MTVTINGTAVTSFLTVPVYSGSTWVYDDLIIFYEYTVPGTPPDPFRLVEPDPDLPWPYAIDGGNVGDPFGTFGIEMITYDVSGGTGLYEIALVGGLPDWLGHTLGGAFPIIFFGAKAPVLGTTATVYPSTPYPASIACFEVTDLGTLETDYLYVTIGAVLDLTTTYAVTVVNGTADKSTVSECDAVTVTAGAAPAGQEFDKWITSSAGVVFANENAEETTFEMPANAVTVEATYKTATVVTAVTFTAAQTGGTADTVDSDGIALTFSTAVSGLTAADIYITDDTGEVTRGALTGSGTTWTVALTGVAVQGDVLVTVVDFGAFTVSTASQTVAVYKYIPTWTVSVTAPAVANGGTFTFTGAVAGYAPAAATTFTVSNTGTEPMTDLTAALSGVDAASFTLDAVGLDATLASGGTTTFTVKPADALPVGSYTATVTLTDTKLSAPYAFTVRFTVTSATTPPVTPTSYTVTLGSMSNGSVVSNKTSATAGETVTLSVSLSDGYELDAITGFRTSAPSTTVTLSGAGLSRTFVMPAYSVPVDATFAKTAAQLLWEKALAVIEAATYDAPQSAAATSSDLAAWLADYINGLLSAAGIPLTVTASDIYVTSGSFVPASTSANGAFEFFVLPSGVTGSSLLSGTIVARTVGVETQCIASLQAYAQDGVLHVSGLAIGAEWRVYNVMGTLIYQGVAPDDVGARHALPLLSRGVYIVTDAKTTIKVVN
jgi:hypothetical protein